MKKYLLLQILYLILSVNSQQFTTKLSSFNRQTTQADFALQGWTGINIQQFSDCGAPIVLTNNAGELIQNTIPLPSHNLLRISYKAYCDNINPGVFQVTLDGEQIGIQNPTQSGNLRAFGCFINNVDDYSHSVTIDHTSSTADLQLIQTADSGDTECVIFSVNVECATFVEPQICSDNIGELMDGEGNTLITNFCEPFLDDGEKYSFKFTTMFLEPFELNQDCFQLEIWFNETKLEEGDGEFDQFSFDGENQKIVWNIKLEDFSSVYNCIEEENEEQMVWICPFSTKIVYDGDVQLEYESKIQVTVDRVFRDSLEIDIQKNVVEGECCENELRIQTELRFCESFECESFLEGGGLTVERKEDFFVEMRIVNAEFQGYYLKFVQASLGEFIPDIVKYDSSVAGKLRIQVKSNIAKPNLVFKVIAQLFKEAVVPSMGGSGLRRNLETENEIESKGQKKLSSNEYKVAAYQEITVVDFNEIQNEKEYQMEIIKQGTISDFSKQFNQNNNNNEDVVLEIVLVGITVFIAVVIVLVVYCGVRMRLRRKKKKGNYLDNSVCHLQQV